MFYEEEEEEIPKVPLFEKALTPSDVGKLNRLVIPKQHAEKCFPLADNGSLLSFEDEGGKSWRFRYSYWSSSQSYVLTKGWSRFVKDKRLHAGDIVVFACHASDAARLFIASRTTTNHQHTTNTRAVADSPAPDQTPTVRVRGNCRTFRLFGVNLECLPDEPEPEPTLHPYQHYYTDNTFSGAGPHHQR